MCIRFVYTGNKQIYVLFYVLSLLLGMSCYIICAITIAFYLSLYDIYRNGIPFRKNWRCNKVASNPFEQSSYALFMLLLNNAQAHIVLIRMQWYTKTIYSICIYLFRAPYLKFAYFAYEATKGEWRRERWGDSERCGVNYVCALRAFVWLWPYTCFEHECESANFQLWCSLCINQNDNNVLDTSSTTNIPRYMHKIYLYYVVLCIRLTLCGRLWNHSELWKAYNVLSATFDVLRTTPAYSEYAHTDTLSTKMRIEFCRTCTL